MRITVCTVDGFDAFNGINAWLLRFLPALQEHGHNVTVLAFPWSRPDLCPTLQSLIRSGITVDAVYPGRYTESAVRACIAHAQKFRPQIFVANMCAPALLAAPALSRMGIRTVSVMHNDDAEYQAKASFPADATVVISEGLRALLPPESNRLVRCIPYGIEQSETTAQPRTPDSPFRVVYHGRIVQSQKRILELAEALVAASRLNPVIHADIYGSGPDEDELRRQLAVDDAEGRVRFMGSAKPAEIRRLLSGYHSAVLLSDYEGLGLAILEAMAAGLVPVCKQTRSGLPDLITHGVNGLFVDDRREGFIAALQKLVLDGNLWARLSCEARRTASTTFHPDTCLRAWENLFSELLKTPADGVPVAAKNTALLPPVHPDLQSEDIRYPGVVRAWWRWFRFGAAGARLPW